MKRKRVLAGLMVLVVAVCALAVTYWILHRERPSSEVQLYVMNQDGQPLPDCFMSTARRGYDGPVAPIAVTTNAQGAVKYDMSYGTYDIEISCPGYIYGEAHDSTAVIEVDQPRIVRRIVMQGVSVPTSGAAAVDGLPQQ